MTQVITKWTGTTMKKVMTSKIFFQEATATAADESSIEETKNDDIDNYNNNVNDIVNENSKQKQDANDVSSNTIIPTRIEEESTNLNDENGNAINDEQVEDTENDITNTETSTDNVEARSEPRYNLRNRNRDYEKVFADNFQFFAQKHAGHGVQRVLQETINLCFTQIQAKTGIKKHGQRVFAAMLKEFVRIKDMEVMGFIRYDDLTSEQKQRALRAINLIKEKRNGVLKGCTVADGRGQR